MEVLSFYLPSFCCFMSLSFFLSLVSFIFKSKKRCASSSSCCSFSSLFFPFFHSTSSRIHFLLFFLLFPFPFPLLMKNKSEERKRKRERERERERKRDTFLSSSCRLFFSHLFLFIQKLLLFQEGGRERPFLGLFLWRFYCPLVCSYSFVFVLIHVTSFLGSFFL